jgi:hypothetical protein
MYNTVRDMRRQTQSRTQDGNSYRNPYFLRQMQLPTEFTRDAKARGPLRIVVKVFVNCLILRLTLP